MNKREIILDFTSLLDVMMVILFFFILFGHLETMDAKAALQLAEQSAAEREKEAEQLKDEAGRLLEQAELKEQQADERLSEAEQAGERSGENVDGISQFSRNMNIRVKLKMNGGSDWSLMVFRGEEKITEIPKNSVAEMSREFSRALSDSGCNAEDTLLCIYVYDATQAGTASADRDIQRVFEEIKSEYKHFFYSETDTSLFDE